MISVCPLRDGWLPVKRGGQRSMKPHGFRPSSPAALAAICGSGPAGEALRTLFPANAAAMTGEFAATARAHSGRGC